MKVPAITPGRSVPRKQEILPTCGHPQHPVVAGAPCRQLERRQRGLRACRWHRGRHARRPSWRRSPRSTELAPRAPLGPGYGDGPAPDRGRGLEVMEYRALTVACQAHAQHLREVTYHPCFHQQHAPEGGEIPV